MTALLWGLGGCGAALAAAALAEAWIKRGRHRPLSAHRPALPGDGPEELGLEATDMTGYRAVLKRNDLIGAQRTHAGTFRARFRKETRAPGADQGDNA
ncbi:hypothetical protein [Poseidonocella sp. HB161398]|uniref:hypothetical protein n=1 Tax=Poseidonocella sp. HB161398 TaxID=2320855 RepID=UPI0011086F27|nr:hypothetical protein [Poseidonocella sp. HB161398]